jgi:hypothetical protein
MTKFSGLLSELTNSALDISPESLISTYQTITWCHNSVDHNINPLNAELNSICHLLALLESAIIVDVSGLRVNLKKIFIF